MIAADKRALAADVQQQVLRIREREVNLFTANLNALGTQAALVAGFAFAGIVDIDFEYKTESVGEWFYLIFIISTLVSELYCVCAATFITVWGPTLAVRGTTPAAMHAAVDGMKRERRHAFASAFVGIVFFVFAGISLVWVRANPFLAALLTVIFIAFMVMVSRYGLHVYSRFRMQGQEDDALATYAAYAAAGDNDGNANSYVNANSYGNANPQFSPPPRELAAADAPSSPAQARRGSSRSSGSIFGRWLSGEETGEGGARRSDGDGGAAAAHLMSAAALSRLRAAAARIKTEALVKLPEAEGGLFVKRFLVFSGGGLDLYLRKSDYTHFKNALNDEPLVLADYRVVTDAFRVTGVDDVRYQAGYGFDFAALGVTSVSRSDAEAAAVRVARELAREAGGRLDAAAREEVLQRVEAAYISCVSSLRVTLVPEHVDDLLVRRPTDLRLQDAAAFVRWCRALGAAAAAPCVDLGRALDEARAIGEHALGLPDAATAHALHGSDAETLLAKREPQRI